MRGSDPAERLPVRDAVCYNQRKKGVSIMTQKGTTNIIIQLKGKGWTGDEIVAFLGFIETHNPSEEELKKALNS